MVGGDTTNDSPSYMEGNNLAGDVWLGTCILVHVAFCLSDCDAADRDVGFGPHTIGGGCRGGFGLEMDGDGGGLVLIG